MSALDTIASTQLSRRVGTPDAPAVIDVRVPDDHAAAPRMLPASGLPVRPEGMPARGGPGRTAWVTRARPKIDRVACPWLIRRFVGPGAVFLFVTPAGLANVADRICAAPQAAGLVAASRGSSRMYRDDVAEFDAAMGLYDAFYCWARVAVGETHNWPAARP